MQLSLSGKWNLKGAGHTVEASIPGDFHSALIEAGVIPDPYFGKNEQELLWLNQEDFILERTFMYVKVPKSFAILELTEVDTIFDLYINDKLAGSGNNMFLRHRFNITSLLKNGENTIKIIFHSAEKEAKKESEKLPYPVPYNKADVFSPNRNLIRKCQSHSGWDWGPCLMVSGIYGDIFIDTVTTGLFDSLKMNFSHKHVDGDDLWKIKCLIEFDSFIKTNKDFTVNISGLNLNDIEIIKNISLEKGKNQFEVTIPVKNPSIWKTAEELKEDDLEENIPYFISIKYKGENSNIKTFTRQFFFHDLKCITKKEKNGGRSLYFQNNGRKIFAKGANWIPADALPSRWEFDTYYDLLKSAKDANMNCIRVWGGGIYEKDCFYQICDRLGLIVWQDFMFACALYPVTEDFLKNVRDEVIYQINRLQSYACIGIWCGNNENFGTLTWFPESRQNRDRYLVDYDRLYQGLIGPLVKQLDPDRLWWPSSPCAGPDDFADNWHSDNQGDMHYWSVWHEKKNFEAYLDIKPRFVSEFGYESMVSKECIKTYSTEEDMNFTSPISEYHQRSPSGNTLLLESFARYFRFPNGFENQIYLSQVQQAVAIRTAVDWWRSLEPYCMGALVWQLNDVWPGPSWSSIEYGGNWKLLHYAEKEMFEPVHLSQMVKDGNFSISVINDYKEDLNCTVKIDYYDFSGKKLSKTQILKSNVKSGKPELIFTGKSDSEDYPKGSFFVNAVLEAKKNDKVFKSETTIFPSLYKHCNLEHPEIKTKVTVKENIAEIEVTSEKPAFFTSLDSHNLKGRFSRNCFTVLPDTPVTVTFTPIDKQSLKNFTSILTVKSLRETY
ncbi:MAG: glycoside hydrolase family 2 protein [Treponema sp.]|nr:glycoside hydrolase family 2 protein [Treponema sp.]